MLGWSAGQNLDANYKYPIWVGSIQGTQVNDNYNGFPGECVSLGKALSHIQTAGYTRGRRVMDGGITKGTVIATFSDPNTFSGHLAIFEMYATLQGPNVRKDGFRVWDQNFVSSHAVGRHELWPEGSGVYNANNYYVVQIP